MTGRCGDTLQSTSIHHSRKWDKEGTVGGGSGRPGGMETHSDVRPSTTQESGMKKGLSGEEVDDRAVWRLTPMYVHPPH